MSGYDSCVKAYNKLSNVCASQAQWISELEQENEKIKRSSSVDIQLKQAAIIKSLEKDKALAIEALEYVNNTAPPMYKYNEVELRMVLKAREALAALKEKGE